MTVVDIYCRVSTEDQEDNYSFPEQKARAIEYCTEHNLVIGHIWLETHSGAEYRERPKLDKMRRRYREGKIQGVVFYAYDRLARKQSHQCILLEEMEYYGIATHCTSEQLEDTLEGRVTKMLLGLLAEVEWEKIRQRTLTGRINKAKEGDISVSGYKLVYWLQWHDPVKKDYPITHPERTSLVQELAERYVSGESANNLAKELNQRKILPPSGEAKWNRRTVRLLLVGGGPMRLDYFASYPETEAILLELAEKHGEDYAEITKELIASNVPPPEEKWCTKSIINIITDNRLTGKGVVVFHRHLKGAKKRLEPVAIPDGVYPQVISDELAQKIKERATDNRDEASRRGKNPEEFLLRAGYLKCHCGSAMIGITNHKLNRKGLETWTPYFYLCSNAKCHYKFASKKFDASIWEEIEKLAGNAQLIEEAIKLATSEERITKEASSIEASIATWKAKADNYLQDLEDVTLRGDSRAAVRQLFNQANEIVEQLEYERVQITMGLIDKEREREAYEHILDWCRKVKDNQEELDYRQKRDFFKLLGLLVTVLPREKRKNGPINYNMQIQLPDIQALIPLKKEGFARNILANAPEKQLA